MVIHPRRRRVALFRRVIYVLTCILTQWVAPAFAQQPAPPDGTLSRVVYDLFYEPALSTLREATPAPGAGSLLALTIGAPGDEVARLTSALASEPAVRAAATGVAGFTFTFDPLTRTFERRTSSFGSLIAERPITIGYRKVSVGLSSQHLSFGTWSGTNLAAGLTTRTSASAIFQNSSQSVTTATTTSLHVTSDRMTTFAVFGVTDWLDAGVVVPFTRTQIRGTTDVVLCTGTCGGAALPRVQRNAAHVGIDDVVVRGKVVAFRGPEDGGLAFGVDVTMPTGDPDQFEGSGVVEATPHVIAGYSFGRVSSHIDLGATFARHGSSSFVGHAVAARLQGAAVNYTAGVTLEATPRLTLSVDVVGRRLTAAAENHVSLAVGGRFNIVGSFLLSGNVLVPISNSGLVSRPSAVLGLEFPF